MNISVDDKLIDTIYEYAYGITYLIVINVSIIPIYIILNYLVLAIGLNMVFILLPCIIQTALVIIISNKYVLRSIIYIDFRNISKIDPFTYQTIGLITLLLSLLMSILSFLTNIYFLEAISKGLWIIYLSSLLYTTYLFHKIFDNNTLALSITIFIAIGITSFFIPIPYFYLLLFIPLVLKQHGLKNTLEYIEKVSHGLFEENSIYEQVIRSTIAEFRETIVRNILESFKSIGKTGVFLLVSSIIELVLYAPVVIPHFTYIFKLPVLNIEPSYVQRVIAFNIFTNWGLVQEYLPIIVIYTVIYSLVLIIHITCLYGCLGKASALLSTYDSEYSKLTLITYSTSIIYAIYLLILIVPMYIAINIYTTGFPPAYMSEFYSIFLNEIYNYAPFIYVFLKGCLTLLITNLVLNKVSRDFSSPELSIACSIIPVVVFLNTIKAIALLIDLLRIEKFMWISNYILLMTAVDLLLTPLIAIAIAYGGYRLHFDFYSEVVYKQTRMEEEH